MTFLRGVFKCGVFEETTFVWKYHETAEIFIFWQIGEDSGRKGNKVKFVKVLKSSDKSFFYLLSPLWNLEGATLINYSPASRYDWIEQPLSYKIANSSAILEMK